MLKPTIEYPVIQKGGSRPEDLIEEQRAVRQAAKALYAALAAARPLPQDYPDNEARQRAYDQHKDRLVAVAQLKQDADRILGVIHRQTGYKWVDL